MQVEVYTHGGEGACEWMKEKHKAGEQVLSSVKSGDQTDDGNKAGKGRLQNCWKQFRVWHKYEEKPIGEIHLYTNTPGEALPGACLPESQTYLLTIPMPKNPF